MWLASAGQANPRLVIPAPACDVYRRPALPPRSPSSSSSSRSVRPGSILRAAPAATSASTPAAVRVKTPVAPWASTLAVVEGDSGRCSSPMLARSLRSIDAVASRTSARISRPAAEVTSVPAALSQLSEDVDCSPDFREDKRFCLAAVLGGEPCRAERARAFDVFFAALAITYSPYGRRFSTTARCKRGSAPRSLLLLRPSGRKVKTRPSCARRPGFVGGDQRRQGMGVGSGRDSPRTHGIVGAGGRLVAP